VLEAGAEAGVATGTLPLEVFDSTDYESRMHEEWVPKRAGVPPTRGQALLPVVDQQGTHVLRWQQVLVLDFSVVSNTYRVQLVPGHPSLAGGSGTDGERRGGDPALIPAPRKSGGGAQTTSGIGAVPPTSAPGVGPGAGVWVPRVTLCFSAEDPAMFARRFAAAHRARAAAESALRKALYIDCMPLEDIAPLTSEQVGASA
jgi:dynein heavy chain, axonemal